MTGGPVFRPLQAASRCCIPSPHRTDAMEAPPPAAYLVFVEDCQAFQCAGGLWCLGHPVCVDCGIGVREGRLVYLHREETPRIRAVMSQ